MWELFYYFISFLFESNDSLSSELFNSIWESEMCHFSQYFENKQNQIYALWSGFKFTWLPLR